MRKNSVRKWLHAILDLLPLFVIPIFAIYTRNENYNSNIEIQLEQNTLIDFNQLATTNNGNGSGYGVSWSTTDNITTFSGTSTTQLYVAICQTNISTIYNHVYVLKGNLNRRQSLDMSLYLNDNGTNRVDYGDGVRFVANQTASNKNLTVNIPNNTNTNNFSYAPQFFDLTQMFGVGNEPTLETFNSLFTNTYYDYTLSKQKSIVSGTTTYNDADVGSQFVYTLYNATDKYFNCTNLFNLEQVWNWVQLNLFGGNAPLMVYVVWQVIVYEFFMDLIFLLYSVFMFVIDFAENCLERPFDKIRRL